MLGIVLVAGSTLRVIGDGPEYIGTSLNFIDGRGVAMTRGEVVALHDRFATLGPPLAQWDVERGTLRDRRGQRQFGHFWMYSALAAPFVAAGQLFRLSPLAGFAAFNILLYAIAWHVLARHASWRVQILLLTGPIVWWLDKAHTEVFTVACLTIAAALLRSSPWWAAAAAALASTQNPPLAIFALGALALTWWRHADRLRGREVLVAGAATIALAVLHPVYYLIRFGVVSPLIGFSTRRFPALDEIGLVLWDPSLGLAGSWPVLLLATAIAGVVLVRRARPFPTHESIVVLATLAAVLVSVAQTLNPVHGGTPGLSRYALWLGPLLLPWLIEADRSGGRADRAALAALAVVSAAIGLYAFHPSRAELSHRPTAMAAWLWKERPSWNNPLPAVFALSIEPHGRQMLPVANDGCRKALLIGQGENANIWPSACPSVAVPDRCRERGALCYANAGSGGYQFVPIARRYWPGFAFATDK